MKRTADFQIGAERCLRRVVTGGATVATVHSKSSGISSMEVDECGAVASNRLDDALEASDSDSLEPEDTVALTSGVVEGTSGARRALRNCFQDGPRSLTQLLDWYGFAVQSMQDFDAQFSTSAFGRLQNKLKRKLYLMTFFSGSGCHEAYCFNSKPKHNVMQTRCVGK